MDRMQGQYGPPRLVRYALSSSLEHELTLPSPPRRIAQSKSTLLPVQICTEDPSSPLPPPTLPIRINLRSPVEE
jgi:hypothetical protein